MANPPEVFLDLCDLLQLENRIDLVTARHSDPSAITDAASSQQFASVMLSDSDKYANSMFGEIGILAHRAVCNIVRTPDLFLARVGASVFFGIMVSE
jgi:hypothetical protein